MIIIFTIANTVGEGNIITFQFDVDDGLDVTCSFRGTAIEPCKPLTHSVSSECAYNCTSISDNCN